MFLSLNWLRSGRDVGTAISKHDGIYALAVNINWHLQVALVVQICKAQRVICCQQQPWDGAEPELQPEAAGGQVLMRAVAAAVAAVVASAKLTAAAAGTRLGLVLAAVRKEAAPYQAAAAGMTSEGFAVQTAAETFTDEAVEQLAAVRRAHSRK